MCGSVKSTEVGEAGGMNWGEAEPDVMESRTREELQGGWNLIPEFVIRGQKFEPGIPGRRGVRMAEGGMSEGDGCGGREAGELSWRGVELFIHSNEAVGDWLVGNWT